MYNVTVTNSNGCPGITSATTATTALPTPVISGGTLICAGSSRTLDAGAGYSSYAWSTGATTQTISVSTAAVFNVTVTNSNACSGSTSATTGTVALPIPSIAGTTTFCAGNSTTLTATAGFSSYLWSTGATTQSISVNTTGTYSVTVTNSNSCQGSKSVTATQIALPTPSISGSTVICAGNTTTLDAGAGYSSYAWSTGLTTRTITSNIAAVYNVTVTNSNGCIGITSATTTTASLPTPSITGTTTFCAGNSTTLTANAGYSSYLWSNGATTQSISVNSGGPYSVTVVNSNTCQASTSITTTLIALPTPSITGNTPICPGGSITLSAGAGFSSYLWSTGATSQTVAAVTGTALNVVVTNANGCQGTTSVVTTVASPPTPSIGGSTSFCIGKSTTLTAVSGYSTYAWSTGASTQSIVVSTATTVSVAMTTSDGCQGTVSATTSTLALPTPTITGSTTICAGTTATLNAGSFTSYQWSTGSTSQTITPNIAAVFNVTVTNSGGCQAVASATTTTVSLPTPSITGTTTFCAGGSTSLTATAGYSTYLWSTGATTQSITATGAGVYSVTVTNSNACQASTSISTSTIALPSPTITGNTAVCPSGSTALNAGSGFASYLWSTGAVTQTIAVNTNTAVNVTVTNASGCQGTASVVTSIASIPTPSITGTSTFCAGKSTTLTATPGYSAYLWSTGVTTQTASVNTATTISVTATNSNGCQGVGTLATNTIALPTPTITGATAICAGTTTTLTANSGYTSYLWSTGLTTQSITTNIAAVYNVSVTNSSGCQGFTTVTTSTVALPTPSITGASTFCAGNSASLTATAGYPAYLWSTGATTQSITVNTAGVYTVQVTNSNSCQAVASVTAVSVALPTPTITGNTSVCSGSFSIFNAGAGYSSYLWSTGATTSTISVNTATSVNVTVSNSGCQGTTSVITNVISSPTPAIAGNTTLCAGSTTTLDVGGGYSSYQWSTGLTSQSITANTPAVYNVTVTGSNGCKGITSATTTTVALPTPTITGTFTFCAGGSANITANSGYTAYLWSTGATTQSISVSSAGVYTVLVTNSNGCQAVASATVNSIALPTPTITGNTSVCSNSFVILNAGAGYSSYLWSTGATASTISVVTATLVNVTVTSSTSCQGSASFITNVVSAPSPSITGTNTFCAGSLGSLDVGGGYVSYLWSNGATTQSIAPSTAAVFNVTVTNSNTCSAVASVTTTTLALPTPTISGSTTICAGSSNTLVATPGFTAYSWSTGATTQSITVSTPGTYSVVVTNSNGCQGVKSVTTTTVALPTPAVTGGTTICVGNTTTLNAGTGYTAYAWSSGATTQTLAVTTATTLTVTVTTSLGCQGVTTVTTTTVALPTPTITGTATFCAGSTTTLNAGAGYSSYVWSTGATTQTLAVNTASVFSVTVTNSNGCQGVATVTTTTLSLPTPSIAGTTSFCTGSSTTLTAGSGFSSYLWSTGSTSQSITVSTAAVFNLTVTNANACQGFTSATTTTLSLPVVSVSGSTAICVGNTNTLTASSGNTAYVWSTGATTQSITVNAPATLTVTATNSNGCQGVKTVTTNTIALPTPTITGTFTFCSNANTTLSAGAGFSSYLWSTGALSQSITSNIATVYNVTVTNSSGCQGVASATTTTLVAPTPTIAGTASFCTGSTTTLTANSGYVSYLWSNSSTSQSITPSTAAVFNVSVTSGNGCQGVASITTTLLALPVPSIAGPTIICTGNTNTLTASSGNTAYVWSTGATTQSITINTPAVLTVTVTNANGCKGAKTVTTSTVTLPTPTITGTFTFCSNNTTTLDAGAGYSAYLWSTGATTQSITPGTEAVFNVTVTNSNGCQGVTSATTTTLTSPSPSITGAASFCAGASTTLDVGSGYTSYLWSTGSTSQSVTVTNSGLYTVTVSISNACQGVTSMSATAVPLPLPSISGPTAICIGNTNTLSASPGYSAYAWSSGATTQSITTNSPSVLSVTVTSSLGCQGVATATTNTVALPTPSITGNATFCIGNTTTLSAGSGYSAYAWSTGATTPSITVTTATNVNVLVTTSLGCQGTASLTTVTNTVPVPAISGATIFCAGSTTTLDVGAGYTTYTWSTGASTRSITPSTAAVFNVTVTNAAGCQGVTSVTTTTVALPVPSISGATAICIGNTNTFVASPGYSAYAWSTGATTPSVVVSVSGPLTVTVTNSTGCQGVATVTTNTVALPVPVVSGATAICVGNTTTLTANSGYTAYSWSTGATTPSITVNTATTVNVTVTTSLGCQGTTTLSVISNTLPVPVITGTTAFCAGTPAMLEAGAGYSAYVWSTGATTHTINITTSVVTATAAFNVTVTNSNGCRGTASVNTTVYALPVPTISGPLAMCAGNTNTLTANSGYTAYLWNTGVTTPSITVNTATVLSVVVTNSNGCVASKSVTTVVNPLPTPAITGNTLFCANGSSTLSAGAGYLAYLWSTGSTNQNITVNTATTVNVTVTTLAGCSASTSILTSTNASPTPSITGTPTFCANNHVVLTASAGYNSYLWSTAASTQSIIASTTGTFLVTVLDNNGCQGTGSFVTTVIPIPATATITQTGNTLSSSAATGNQWYHNGVLIPNATGQTYSPSEGGYYSVLVSQNECTSNMSAPVLYFVVGLSNLSNDLGLSVYPNPAKDLISVEGELVNQGSFEISLYDMQGKLVVSYTDERTIDVSSLNNGMYILTIKKGDSADLRYRKIIIMH